MLETVPAATLLSANSHATERQFKGGFSHIGIQVFRCGQFRRGHLRPATRARRSLP